MKMKNKIKSLDDIWWKSINLSPFEVRKVANNTKTNFIFRERYGKTSPKRRFWKNDYVFIRELWHPDFFSNGHYIYESDNSYPYVSWNPPQQMPRQAAKVFIKIIRIDRKRIQDLRIDEIRKSGFDDREQFALDWDTIRWRKTDKWESNPMVGIYKFRRINIKKYGDGPIVKPRYAEEE